jgi:hypothetical protein
MVTIPMISDAYQVTENVIMRHSQEYGIFNKWSILEHILTLRKHQGTEVKFFNSMLIFSIKTKMVSLLGPTILKKKK